MDFMVAFPLYTKDILELLLSEKQWLIHNFNCKNPMELYTPESYLYNKEMDNWKYILILDTNIYDFLLKSIKKSNEKCRQAIALLIFCQLAEIEIDPALAVSERLRKDNLNEVIQDVKLFYKLNNSNPAILADYALGKTKTIELLEIEFDYDEIKNKLLSYKKPDELESLYLMILKITVIHIDKSIKMKLCYFIDWLIQDFRLGLPAVMYALFLFKKPVSKMMKYKIGVSREENIKNINNMTWDLFIIRDFFKKWTEKKERTEFIFASDDNAFSEILNLAIQVQMNFSFEPCKSYFNLSEYEFDKLTVLINEKNRPKNRAYNSPDWGYDYRKALILECEKILSISDA
jgi:hypothetical protein